MANTDSDDDHMATFIRVLFVRHFRPLVKFEHICISMPPLYRINVGNKLTYALNDKERQIYIDEIEKNERKD
ncbi:MAG: hypothetical protein HRT91_02960 [Piscirickettsiaceae bacterium]|nr:hypothetical protein [Piscirickettsiaceae bacterium]